MASTNQPAQSKPAQPADKTTNGDKPRPATGAAPTGPTEVTGAPASTNGEAKESGEEKSRGVIPQMPIAVVWKEPSGMVVAALIHPRGGEYKVRGKGLGGTTGSLADDGYPIGPIRADGPKWVEARIPKDVTILGYANVQGFPLPTGGV
jgi:hypothetical protein